MTARKRLTALLVMLALSAASLMAQPAVSEDDWRANWPPWLWDLRRGEIVAFGTFPFTMFFTTFGMNMVRWQRDSGMSWEQREMAPWPFTSSGAISMTNSQQATTIAIAAGLSVTVAVVDHLIVRFRRNRAARRAEALPAGAVTIIRTPINAPPPDEDEEGEAPYPPP